MIPLSIRSFVAFVNAYSSFFYELIRMSDDKAIDPVRNL